MSMISSHMIKKSDASSYEVTIIFIPIFQILVGCSESFEHESKGDFIEFHEKSNYLVINFLSTEMVLKSSECQDHYNMNLDVSPLQ